MHLSNFTYEAASGLITGQFRDTGPDIPIVPATLSIMIFDRQSGTIIKIATNLTPISTYVDVNGNFTYYILPSDNTILDSTKDREIHVARLVWTWTAQGNQQTGKSELQFEVVHLSP